MSLLNPNQPSIQASPLVRQTNRILRAPRQMLETLVRDWETSYDLLWRDDGQVTPAQRLAEIGTYGGELFDRSTALVTFILTQLGEQDPATTARLLTKINSTPPTTRAPNGIVVID